LSRPTGCCVACHFLCAELNAIQQAVDERAAQPATPGAPSGGAAAAAAGRAAEAPMPPPRIIVGAAALLHPADLCRQLFAEL
jgi:hypothetical protein